jgi:tRNA threonylcarbamoyl adenosine modification protein YeaZ
MTEPLLLCLDASSTSACVGVACGSEVLAEELLMHKREHAERMYATIERVLAIAKLELRQLDALVVGLGPGSFIGVRIAVATAKGLALGANKPIVGVSTALSLAANVSVQGLVGVVIDAKKGQVYASTYERDADRLVERLAPTALTPEQCAQEFVRQQPFACVLGDGVERFREVFAAFEPVIRESAVVTTKAMAFTAVRRAKQHDFDDVATLAPQYVRRAEAEEKRLAAQTGQ